MVAQVVHYATLGSTSHIHSLCSFVYLNHSNILIPTKTLLRLTAELTVVPIAGEQLLRFKVHESFCPKLPA